VRGVVADHFGTKRPAIATADRDWPEVLQEATLGQVTVQRPDPDERHRFLPDVAEAFSRVGQSLEGEPDLQRTVQAIVAAAVETVPGVEHAGVSVLESGRLRTIASSSGLGVRLNKLEHRLGEGPCVDATVEHHSYRTGNLATDTRWPRFAPAAAELGVSSMVGFRLGTSSTTLGSLDLYSTRRDAFNTESEHIGDLFAAHAAIALLGSQSKPNCRPRYAPATSYPWPRASSWHARREPTNRPSPCLWPPPSTPT
jgi:transcriptional regulator with GAF, ATPase, and Fis domain